MKRHEHRPEVMQDKQYLDPDHVPHGEKDMTSVTQGSSQKAGTESVCPQMEKAGADLQFPCLFWDQGLCKVKGRTLEWVRKSW